MLPLSWPFFGRDLSLGLTWARCSLLRAEVGFGIVLKSLVGPRAKGSAKLELYEGAGYHCSLQPAWSCVKGTCAAVGAQHVLWVEVVLYGPWEENVVLSIPTRSSNPSHSICNP